MADTVKRRLLRPMQVRHGAVSMPKLSEAPEFLVSDTFTGTYNPPRDITTTRVSQFEHQAYAILPSLNIETGLHHGPLRGLFLDFEWTWTAPEFPNWIDPSFAAVLFQGNSSDPYPYLAQRFYWRTPDNLGPAGFGRPATGAPVVRSTAEFPAVVGYPPVLPFGDIVVWIYVLEQWPVTFHISSWTITAVRVRP